jgi:hypothetical protein
MEEPSMLRSTGDRVVIVGGGIAGALLAKTLQNHADVVLIDPYVNTIAVCFFSDPGWNDDASLGDIYIYVHAGRSTSRSRGRTSAPRSTRWPLTAP